MTDDEKLEKLKDLTGETDEDVLSIYLDMAKDRILFHLYPFGDGTESLPDRYDTLQVEIAMYLLNRRGTEGEITRSENGVSVTWGDSDIPPYLLRRITPMAVVVG